METEQSGCELPVFIHAIEYGAYINSLTNSETGGAQTTLPQRFQSGKYESIKRLVKIAYGGTPVVQ